MCYWRNSLHQQHQDWTRFTAEYVRDGIEWLTVNSPNYAPGRTSSQGNTHLHNWSNGKTQK